MEKERSMKNSIFKRRPLRLEDLPWLLELGRVEDGSFIFERGLKGTKLRTGATVPVEKILETGHGELVKLIVEPLIKESPRLLPLVFENEAMIQMARHMWRWRKSPRKTFYLYTYLINCYSRRIGKSPDELISDVKGPSGLPDFDRMQVHARGLMDYLDELRDRGLASSRIANYAKAIKALYNANGVALALPYAIARKKVWEIEAFTPKQLQMVLDHAEELRDKFSIAAAATGGFRPGTLVRLVYRHVKHELERGIVPIHVHVEEDITKGQYCDYDTFLGPEAAHYLKLDLDSRRKGSRKIPPEHIHDESPLLRDLHSREPKSIGEKQLCERIRKIIHKVDQLKPQGRRKYTFTSLRKFFKTQMDARVKRNPSPVSSPNFVEYMMGHKLSTYDKIKSLGVEFIRDIYNSANLRIEPEPKVSELELLKKSLAVQVREYGRDPDEVIRWDVLAEPHRVFVSPEEHEEHQIRVLSSALKEQIKREILEELRPFAYPQTQDQNVQVGGAARI